MKCPKCGYDIPDGYLLCEHCGSEIMIVPDFEPEIDTSISEVLSTVADELEPNLSDEHSSHKSKKDKKIIEDDNPFSDGFFMGMKLVYKILALVISGIVIFSVGAFSALKIYQNNSYSYQLAKAKELKQNKQFDKSLVHLEKAAHLKDDNPEIILLMAECYRNLDEYDKAIDLLTDTVTRKILDTATKEQFYDLLISLLSDKGDYQTISDLILQSKDSGLIKLFNQYLAMKPSFGYNSGEYDKPVSLKIMANTEGTVYYTIDGSEPNEKSEVYTNPIFLESGEYEVKVLFVNAYGVQSEIATSFYLINNKAPLIPEISLDSGNYNVPMVIEVFCSSGGKIYYTTNRSDPTEESIPYTDPIPLPYGNSNFKFVCISEDGYVSEIVERSYSFKFDTNISVYDAVNAIKQALMGQKILTDMQGHSPEISGRYTFVYDSIIEIPGYGYYYKVNEYIQGESGSVSETGRLYAVEVYTGSPNRLIFDEYGNPGLISLIK